MSQEQLKPLTAEQRSHLLAEIEKQERALHQLLKQAGEADRFWTFKPHTGQLSEERWTFLRKWLKPEDVPAKLDSQEDTFLSPAQIIATFGGNQVGKTTSLVVKTCIKVTGETPIALRGIYPAAKLPKGKGPIYGRVYSPSASTINEVIVPKFMEWMPKKFWHPEGWERTYSKSDSTLRFYLKGKFIGQVRFFSYEQEVGKTQGASLSFVHFDEEPPYEFYKEALPRFAAMGRLDIEFFMTPTNGLSWVKELILDKQDGTNIACFKVASITNPYIAVDVLDGILGGLDTYEERKMRLLGEFVSLSGLIYKGESEWKAAVHLVDPFELDWGTYVVYRGLDVHLSKPTCCVELAVDPAGVKYVVGVYYEDTDTEKVKEALAKRAVERRYRLGWTRYDKSLDYEIKALGGINIIQKLKMPPNPIQPMFPSEKYDGSIEAGVDAIKQDLKPDKFTGKPTLYFFNTPEVWTLIRDIQALERDKARNEDQKGMRDKILEGRRDRHAALRYIYQAYVEWIPVDSEGDGSVEWTEERYI